MLVFWTPKVSVEAPGFIKALGRKQRAMGLQGFSRDVHSEELR